MTDSVTKPCDVEAFDSDVVLECGTAATTLTPEVARDAGRRLIEEARKAEAEQQGKDG